MKLERLKVKSHRQIATKIFELVLQLNQPTTIIPGQFAMLKIEGKFLKRPLSISDFSETTVTFVYKVLGAGTQILSQSNPTEIECLLPLGNGFTPIDKPAVIIAGGIGIAPMHALVKQLTSYNRQIDVHLGYRTKDEIFLDEQLGKYANVTVYTEDGSAGIKGYCLPAEISPDSYIYSCGPTPMLKAIANNYRENGQLSTEEYMACGFGICAGCAIQLKSGLKKVCQDGPIFLKEEFEC